MSSQLLKSFAWRRAIKKFGQPNKVSQENVNAILEAARLAPTSFGVQPFYIHVVSNEQKKKELRAASYDQPQVEECTHLLVFTARTDASGTVERFIKAKNLDTNDKDFAKVLRASVSGKNPADFREWAISQTFIAFGFSLAAAADLRVGSCPMGGFVASDVHKVLSLPAHEVPVAYLAVGNAPSDDPNDKIQKEANPFPKIRMDLSEIVRELK